MADCRRRRSSSAAPALLADVATSLSTAAEAVAALSGPFKPAIATLTTDLLSPSLGGFARLSALYYAVLARPSPIAALVDFATAPKDADGEKSNLSQRNFLIRDRLGGGNFGAVFEGVTTEPGEPRPGTGTVSVKAPLTAAQKKRRVVLKRVNNDKTYVRGDFLRGGTMALGATEVGRVESYMNAKIKRNPLVSKSCAQYLGTFIAERQEGAFTPGSQWLVWRFESDSTLGDALDRRLGEEFPACLEQVTLGRVNPKLSEEKRDAMVIKSIMRQVLTGLGRLHSIGIVHRDVKPENLLITADGQVKMIDLGAAVDLCTGVNFNPLFGMLDPRYSPPEELVMPRNFPRMPSPILSVLLSPLAWVYGRPDLFDAYSAGVLFMQMCVPELRSSTNIRLFNAEMRQCNFNLEMWRSYRGYKCDLTLLDRNNGAGWDLAKKLVCPRDQFNRGRYSVGQALTHRYFLPEF